MSFLIGVVAVAVLWFVLGAYVKADPRTMVSLARKIGGLLAFAMAGLMVIRGRIDLALPLGYGGLWLLGYGRFPLRGLFGGASKSPGMTSRVRSAALEMELDHDTGALRGRVLAGPQEGADLDGLDLAALLGVYEHCLANDGDGARLLEAYLDRRFPGWRDDAEKNRDAGLHRHPHSGAMTEEEAYEVLGLKAGASDEEIRRAHRALMKRLHPDQGGSTYLATRVNQAKDILLARHR